MIAQSQIGFEAFHLWFLANNEKVKELDAVDSSFINNAVDGKH